MSAGTLLLLALVTPSTSTYIDYDELGRVMAERGNDGQNVRYTYDGNGNIETITDSLNRVTTLHYDALDRLVKSVDAKLKPTEFKYDAGDRLTEVKDPRGLVTTYKYDGFGQLWSQTSPDTGTTAFDYNDAGQRTTLTRNDGSSLAYAYDGVGRLRTITGSNELRRFTYDSCAYGKGQLCFVEQAVNGTNVTKVDLGYTPQGQLAARVDKANGFVDTTLFEYDGMGRLTTLTYPSGIAANYNYSYGQVTSLTATIGSATHNMVTSIEYQPFGPVKRWVYGNGLARNYNYDLDGRLTGISANAGANVIQSLTYAHNANDLIEAMTNGVDADNSHRYEYDELGRLSKDFIGSTTTGTLDQFDAVANRISRGSTASGSAPTIQYAISPTSNRMLNHTGSANRNFVYTPNGHLQSATGWLGNRTYDYDAFDRLKSTTVDGATTSYLINGLDQRVGKTGPLGTRRFVYAGQNTLLGEHRGDGLTGWTNYLYLHGQPVALVSINNNRYFLHTDHLGRPEVMTDGARTPQWKAVNGSYSRTVTLGSGVHIGFPGQYWDEETDTWHNGFRDYDPYTGRYIQSDPIGLAGGLNTYAYVGGNPISRTDPLGLFDVYAIRYRGMFAEANKGAWGFQIVFYGQGRWLGREVGYKIPSNDPRLKILATALKWAGALAGDPAGVSDQPWSKRKECDATDAAAEELYNKMFGDESQINESQLRSFLNTFNAQNPSMSGIYDPNSIIQGAIDGARFSE